jgi:hypothetical protein
MQKIEFDPNKDPNVISIIKQEDGNYIGYMNKNGSLITVRQSDPQIVLTYLITHA